jgi:hypothetical protein
MHFGLKKSEKVPTRPLIFHMKNRLETMIEGRKAICVLGGEADNLLYESFPGTKSAQNAS